MVRITSSATVAQPGKKGNSRARPRLETKRFLVCWVVVVVTVARRQLVWSSVRTVRAGLKATRTTAVAAVIMLQAGSLLSAGENGRSISTHPPHHHHPPLVRMSTRSSSTSDVWTRR